MLNYQRVTCFNNESNQIDHFTSNWRLYRGVTQQAYGGGVTNHFVGKNGARDQDIDICVCRKWRIYSAFWHLFNYREHEVKEIDFGVSSFQTNPNR